MSDFDPEQSLPPSSDNDSPRRPHRSSYRTRAASWIKLWSRETFSRDQMISSLKSLAWVAPLTILIWVYAEREQLDKVTNQTIPITVKSADSRLIVNVIDPADQNITADISGPRVSVEKVTEALKLIPKTEQGVLIEIPGTLLPGKHTISTSQVGDADLFRKAGVTLSNTGPSSIQFEIDTLVDRDLDVQVPPDVQNLVGTPTFEPRKVRISAPATVLDAARDRGQLNVYADFKEFRELKTPGKHDLVNVPLKIAFGDKNVTMLPTAVTASIEVRANDVEGKKNAIPIWVMYTNGFEKQYRAEFDATLRDVTMYGPSEQIDQMLKGLGQQPRARFEVGPQFLPADQAHIAKLQFDLPPGVHMSEADEKRTIDFHLVKQAGAE